MIACVSLIGLGLLSAAAAKPAVSKNHTVDNNHTGTGAGDVNASKAAKVMPGTYVCPEGQWPINSSATCSLVAVRLGIKLQGTEDNNTVDPGGCWALGSPDNYTALFFNHRGTTVKRKSDRNVVCYSRDPRKANATGFLTPRWPSKCEVNTSNFVPECLPAQIFERKGSGDWTYAEYCGTLAASVRVANLSEKDSAHTKVYRLMYDNIISVLLHYIMGMATVGIFVKDKDKEDDPTKPVGTVDKIMDCVWLGSILVGVIYASFTGLNCYKRFLVKLIEYFHGLWTLPSNSVSFPCKSILSLEFLYYKDILQSLALSVFSFLDLVTVVSMLLVWTGCCVNVCCYTLALSSWHCLRFCCTCKWVPPCLRAVKYCCRAFVTCLGRCLRCCFVECPKACCRCIAQCCSQVWWLYCRCGLCTTVIPRCCAACGHSCQFCCWNCNFLCRNCSCLCCMNFCCHDKFFFLSFLIAVVLAFAVIPLFIYLLLGLFVLFSGALFCVLLLLVPILLLFYLASQTLTAMRRLKDVVMQEAEPTRFMDPLTFYLRYYTALCVKVSSELIYVIEILAGAVETVKRENMKAHKSLNEGTTTAATVGETLTKDNQILVACLPLLLVLLLIGSTSVASCTTRQLLYLTSADVAWTDCEIDGTPAWCEMKGEANDWDSNASSEVDYWKWPLPDFAEDELVTVNGIKIPPGWPSFLDVADYGNSEMYIYKHGCQCLSCEDSKPVNEQGAVCGPYYTPSAPTPQTENGFLRKESQRALLSCPSSASYSSDVSSTTGNGDGNDTNGNATTPPNNGGMVLRGDWRTIGEGVLARPFVLNTHQMKVEDSPVRPDCYGLMQTTLATSSNANLEGWCNCSSGRFVPTSFDQVKVAPTMYGLVVGPYVEQREGKYFFGPVREPDARWMSGWLEQQKRKRREWVSTYGADPNIGFSGTVVQDVWDGVAAMAKDITHLFTAIFPATIWVYLTSIFVHFRESVEWLKTEFYTAENFAFAFTAWFRTQESEDFEKMRNAVVLGRSLTAYSVGMAAAASAWQVGDYAYNPLSYGV